MTPTGPLFIVPLISHQRSSHEYRTDIAVISHANCNIVGIFFTGIQCRFNILL